MRSDYHRDQILAAINSGAEDYYRVKVFANQDSKFMNVTADQLRCLADVMDETNPQTLLPMLNDARVIKADVEFDADGIGQGVVLADLGNLHRQRFVIWRVYLHTGQTRWLAEHGDYVSDLDTAVAKYNERRASE